MKKIKKKHRDSLDFKKLERFNSPKYLEISKNLNLFSNLRKISLNIQNVRAKLQICQKKCWKNLHIFKTSRKDFPSNRQLGNRCCLLDGIPYIFMTLSTVTRTNFISAQTKMNLRIVGLSTALANARDLADWLGIKNFGLFNFKPSVRPVPMRIHVQGFPGKHYCPRMALMNKPVFLAIKEHSPKKPVLIFVASRRQTRLTALALISLLASNDNPKPGIWKIIIIGNIEEIRLIGNWENFVSIRRNSLLV